MGGGYAFEKKSSWLVSFFHWITLERITIRVTINSGDIGLDFYQQKQLKSYKCKFGGKKRKR